MKSEELHQELRQRILNLSGVTERQNAGIHEDAFFIGRTMFMHVHGRGHCDIRLPKSDQERVLAEGKARPHRWAPQAGYVTLTVDDEADFGPGNGSDSDVASSFCWQTEHSANGTPIERES